MYLTEKIQLCNFCLVVTKETFLYAYVFSRCMSQLILEERRMDKVQDRLPGFIKLTEPINGSPYVSSDQIYWQVYNEGGLNRGFELSESGHKRNRRGELDTLRMELKDQHGTREYDVLFLGTYPTYSGPDHVLGPDIQIIVGKEGVDCFVANSAFENKHHPTVDKLREYRDNVLSQTTTGRILTTTYYSGVGEIGAKVLDALPSLKPLVRSGLEKLVAKIVEPALQSRKEVNESYHHDK